VRSHKLVPSVRKFHGTLPFHTHFHITDRRRDVQALQMKTCASNLVSAPLVLLLLQPYSLSRDNFVRLKADHASDDTLIAWAGELLAEFHATDPGSGRFPAIVSNCEQAHPEKAFILDLE